MKRLQRLVLGLVAGLLAATGLAMTAQAPAQAATCTSYQYGSGGSGQCVKEIQTMLNGITHVYGGRYPSSCGMVSTGYLTVDGSFGPKTLAKVKSFQKWECLSADGIIGRNTWRELCFRAGQVSMGYSFSPAIERAAWNAAKRAGCAVEYP